MPILDATPLDTDPRGCELLAALLGGADQMTTQAFQGALCGWKVREATEIRKAPGRITVH